jgi:hypothetical protein
MVVLLQDGQNLHHKPTQQREPTLRVPETVLVQIEYWDMNTRRHGSPKTLGRTGTLRRGTVRHSGCLGLWDTGHLAKRDWC